MDQAERLRNIIKNQNRRQHLAKVITVTSGKAALESLIYLLIWLLLSVKWVSE